MVQTIDNITLPTKFYGLITSWGWRTENQVYRLWNGGEHIVQTTQVMRFWANLTNPALQGAAGADVLEFIQFYNGRSGTAFGWLLDFTSFYGDQTGQNIGTGDGSTTQFQLRMNIGDSTRPKYHAVKSLDTSTGSTFAAYEDGGSDTDATVSDSGLVTFSSAPANASVLTADFHPYIPVRFEDDTLNLEHQGNLIHSPNIGILGIIE